jgi:O-antigen/teichoic acid export membrane protein
LLRAGIGQRVAETIGSSVVISAFGVMSGVALARGLHPTGRGELALLLLWPQVVSTLSTAGVDLSATFFSADPERRRNVPATVFALALRQSLVAVPIYLALWPLVFRSAHLGWLPLLMVPLIPVDLVAVYTAACLNGRHDHHAFNAARLTMAPLYAAGVGVLALTGELSVGRGAALFVASNTVLLAAGLLILYRRHGFGRVDRGLRRAVWRFGLRGHLGRLSPQGLGVELVVVGLVLAPRDVGLLAVAIAFLSGARVLTSAVAAVVYPEASAARLSGDPQRVRGLILLTVATTSAGAALLWVLAQPLTVALFGQSFAAAAGIARVLAVGEIARSAYVLVIEALRGSGRPGLTTVAESANWVVFLVAVSVGAAADGLMGVAIGLAIGCFASLGILLALAARTAPRGAVLAPELRGAAGR